MNKEKFLSYWKVQMSGKYNMIMEANAAMREAGLTKEEYFDIISNYSEYRKRYLDK